MEYASCDYAVPESVIKKGTVKQYGNTIVCTQL